MGHRGVLILAVPLLLAAGAGARSSALVGLGLAVLLLLRNAHASARVPLRRLSVRRDAYPSAFEDDTVTVTVTLDNAGDEAASLVEVGDLFGASVADRHALLEPGPLQARHRRTMRYRTFCSRRWGVYALGPLSLSAADPLGLYRSTRGQGGLAPFTVFPKVYEVAALAALGGRRSLTRQEWSAGRPGQGAVYLGVREYRPGDDPRRIHWPATARRGAPVVKEFEVDLLPQVSVFVDLEARHRAGTGLKSTFEYLVRAAASIVWSSVRLGRLTQLFAAGREQLYVPAGRGEAHLALALHELVRARQEGAVPLFDLVDEHRLELPEASTAILVSGTTALLPEAALAAVDSLRARGVQPVMLLVDHDSFAPLGTWPRPRALAREHDDALLAALHGAGVPSARLGADQDLAAELRRADLLEAW